MSIGVTALIREVQEVDLSLEENRSQSKHILCFSAHSISYLQPVGIMV